jgi:Mn-dependent DtxR family transcriptional regulator
MKDSQNNLNFEMDDYQQEIIKLLKEKSPWTVHELLREMGLFLYIFRVRLGELIARGVVRLEEKEIYQHSLVHLVSRTS